VKSPSPVNISPPRNKPPRCSIVIPVYKERANINICLQNLCRLRGIADSEVVVVDGDEGSTLKSIFERDFPFRLVQIISRRGRGVQLNTGAEAASAWCLIFLHVDTILPETGLGLVRRTLKHYDAGAFALGVVGAGGLFNTWLAYVNGRKRLSFTPYGDQAIFMNRDTFRRVGGFPQIPIMEDVGMTDRLKREGVRLKLLHSKVLTSARRWKARGYFVNLLKNTALFVLYRMGVSPWILTDYYRYDSDKTSKKNVGRTSGLHA
jgi:rSAM/selenodomain-associated transferase 2